MKAAALTLLSIYALLALGFTAWFYLQYPVDPNVWPPVSTSYQVKAALAVGFLDAIPAVLTLSLIYDASLRLRRRDALARAAAGEPQADGQQGVFYGTIRRCGPPLTAPLTRRECVLYRYEVTGAVRTTQNGAVTVSNAAVAEGFALTPSTVETASTSVKLFTLVELEFPPDRLTLERVAKNYEEHAATARLQPMTEKSRAAVLRSLRQRPKAEIRYDLGPGTRELRTAHPRTIEEYIVQDGETVAVFGKYSAALGGIVDEQDGIVGTRLYKGPLGNMRKRLARSALWFALGSAACCALAALGAWAFLTYGPPEIGWLAFRSIS